MMWLEVKAHAISDYELANLKSPFALSSRIQANPKQKKRETKRKEATNGIKSGSGKKGTKRKKGRE
jgi:hypothetical protein